MPLAIDVLAAHSDPNPVGNFSPASVTIPQNGYPSHGTLSIDSKMGVITYKADNGCTGSDQFTYEVADDFDLTAKAIVKIRVV